MLDSLLYGDQGAIPTAFAPLLLGVMLAFLCGQPLAWTYADPLGFVLFSWSGDLAGDLAGHSRVRDVIID